MTPLLRLLAAAILLTVFAAWSGTAGAARPASGGRVLFVNSYHPGYSWSDREQRGAEEILTAAGVEMRVAYMDTKRKKGEASAEAAVTRILGEMAHFKPDVVIAADDNAQRFLVVPHLKNGPVPVIFCGVNWDIAAYGYPTPYVTGMVEVESVVTLVNHLRQFATGDRLGFLSDDSQTGHKVFANYDRRFFAGRITPYFVSTYAQFKESFLRAQEEVDMLLVYNNAAIPDWDDADARQFVLANSRKPTGASLDCMSPWVLITLAKVPEEQGRFAARKALDILAGVPPVAIPVTWNEQSELVVNLDIARTGGFVLPLSLLRASSRVLGGNGTSQAKTLHRLP